MAREVACFDFDALAASMDMKDAAVFVKELDYATYEVTEDKLKIVIKSHRSDENFLATILEVASGAAFAMMGGEIGRASCRERV